MCACVCVCVCVISTKPCNVRKFLYLLIVPVRPLMIVAHTISSICFHASVTYDLLWLFSWNIGDWSISHVDLSGSLCGWVRNYENVKCEISIKRPCSVLRKRKHSNAIKNVGKKYFSTQLDTPKAWKNSAWSLKISFMRHWEDGCCFQMTPPLNSLTHLQLAVSQQN